MSKTFRRSALSPGVSRSNSRVPRPRRCSAWATEAFRGLSRLLPLPWAKRTIPRAPAGTCRSPSSSATPVGMTTSRSRRSRKAGSGGRLRFSRSNAATSSSDVCSKSRYQIPTATKWAGVTRLTTWSASLRSSLTVWEGATGTATMTRRAPRARAMRTAARAVAPVANPSSTMTTVRPSTAIGGLSSRYRLMRRTSSSRSLRLHLGDVPLGQPDTTHQIVVEEADTLLTDGPEAQLGLEGKAEFSHHDDIERRPQGAGHLGGHGYAAPREGQYHRVFVFERREQFGQMPTGISSIGEDHVSSSVHVSCRVHASCRVAGAGHVRARWGTSRTARPGPTLGSVRGARGRGCGPCG